MGFLPPCLIFRVFFGHPAKQQQQQQGFLAIAVLRLLDRSPRHAASCHGPPPHSCGHGCSTASVSSLCFFFASARARSPPLSSSVFNTSKYYFAVFFLRRSIDCCSPSCYFFFSSHYTRTETRTQKNRVKNNEYMYQVYGIRIML